MGVGGPSVAGISQHYVNGQLPPEPPKSRWDRCNLPPTPWLVVPILFIEMLLLVAPASFLPRIILNFFDQSYPVTSIVTGAIDSIGGMLAFLMSPTFGKWSDIHGRKSVMLILSTVGLIPVLCLSFYPYLSLWFYLAARALTKISAFGILYSCISDLAPASSRGRLYAQTTGIGMSAICLGPLLSLLLNATWIFRVSGVLALIVLVYVRFLMPETLWLGFKRIEEEEEEKRLKQIQESLNNDGRDLEVLHTNTNETTKEDVGEHSTQEGVDHDHDDDQPQQPNPSFSSVSTDDLRTSLLITSPVATRHLALNASDDESDVAPVVVTSTMSVQSSSDGSEEIPNGASSSLNPFKAIKVAFTSPHHGQLALIILFSQLSSNGIFECALLYLQYKLDFDSSDIAKLMLGMGGWSAIVMVFIMPLLLRMKDDRFVLAFSLMMDFAHQLLYMSATQEAQREPMIPALIPDKKYFWFISFCQGFGFLAFPASNALLSHSVSDAEQGAILAMSTGIRSLTQGAAPILFNGLFSYFTWDRAFVKLPQAPFILSSTFIVIAIILTLRLPKTQAHPTLSTEAEAADKTVTSNLENELLLPIADSLSEGAIL